MSGRHDLDVMLPWMRQGTAYFLAAVEGLPDDAFGAPSALPGWSRGHVVGNVARNAEALGRLVAWARTGVETAMYDSRDQRAAAIEASAGQRPATLRSQAAQTARALDEALTGLDGARWNAPARSALGREIPVAEVPWMRVREVWLHAVDLAVSAAPPPPRRRRW